MNTLKKVKLNIDLVQIATVLFAVKLALQYGSLIPFSNVLDNVIAGAAYLCFLIKILSQRFTLGMFISYLVLGSLALATSLIARNFSLLITVSAVMALREYDFHKFVKTLFCAMSVLLALFVVCSVIYSFLVSSDGFITQSDSRWRFNFGFNHANVFSIFLFCDLMMYIWLCGKRLTLLKLFIVLCIQIVSYLCTRSRTPMVLMLGLIILIMFEKTRFGKKSIPFLTAVIVPLMSFFIWLLIAHYWELAPVSQKIDSFFNSRIRLGGFAYSKMGSNFFGCFVPFRENMGFDAVWGLTSFTFDNIYSCFIVNFGWVWLVVLSVVYLRLCKKIRPFDCIFLLIWAIYGLSEDIILNGFSCFPIFFSVFAFRSRTAQVCVNKNNTLKSASRIDAGSIK